MTIALRDDITYIVLKKIEESSPSASSELTLTSKDFGARSLSGKELMDNLDYLTEKDYINAQLRGNEDGETATLEATLKNATLTDKGRKTLEKMQQHPPASISNGSTVAISKENMGFLEKVMFEANLNDIFDARDLTVVVYRVMRDMMTTEAADRIGQELHQEAQPTPDKTLQMEISDLWKDTNPFVGFLSRLRPPLEIKDDRFLFRVANEGSMPERTDAERVVKAVFSATKEQLSADRIAEIAQCLPGKVKQLWNEA